MSDDSVRAAVRAALQGPAPMHPTFSLLDFVSRKVGPDDKDQATLVDLIQRGVLVGVKVFGTDDCCEHGPHTDCPADGFGLCDNFGPHTVGSDCNRAERFLLRPSDEQMTDRVLYEITNGDRCEGKPPVPWVEPRPTEGSVS